MDGRLQLIETKLSALDSASFQNLCDIYLSSREKISGNFHRPGSQIGKLKTTSGTPDTFFRLPDKSVCYVEYTTQSKSLVKKIKDDILKCLDERLTGVSKKEIRKIIICFNKGLTLKQENEITLFAEQKLIQIELIDIQWLATEIYLKHYNIARDILGIPIDTGQVLSLQDFISEYNNKAGKLSTPLDNIFLHRTDELQEIESALSSFDLIVISGAAGVGKTKIALEALNRFSEKNPTFSSFVIAKKDVEIYEDLRIQLQKDKDYILLVDDANRQTPNLLQLFGFFKEQRRGKLKIVLTVRNYALADLLNLAVELDSHKIMIEKFKDEELIDILKSESFNIQNHKFHEKILELSDGNARLAIMAARVALKEQALFLVKDASDLYDSYFTLLDRDLQLFSNQTLLKVFGLISFFYTIDIRDRVFLNRVLDTFDLTYSSFAEALEQLHGKELIEIQFNHAKISEQVLGTYIFYRVFFKEEQLSFKTLLENYFNTHSGKFADSVIPANNAFGYERVEQKVKPSLVALLNQINSNETLTLKVFSTFWFYLGDQVILYFFNKVQLLPEPIEPEYQATLPRKDQEWDRNEVLEHLSRFFIHNTDFLSPALELSFEYCRKCPEYLAELCKIIHNSFSFHADDASIAFQRQQKLLDYFNKRIGNKKDHLHEAFLSIAPELLAHEFRSTHGAKKDKIIIHTFKLYLTNEIKTLRSNIWTLLFTVFKLDEFGTFNSINKALGHFRDSEKEVLLFDLSLLVPFFTKYYSSKNFKHAVFIQDLIFRLKRFDEISTPELQLLQKKFESKEYQLYTKIDWNRRKGKADFDCDYKEFENLKEKDLRKYFKEMEEKDFDCILALIHKIDTLEIQYRHGHYVSLDIIVEEAFLRNPETGLHYIQKILCNYPVELNPLGRTIRAVTASTKQNALRLWQMLAGWPHSQCIFWKLEFFYTLPGNVINKKYLRYLIETFESIKGACCVSITALSKFQKSDPAIFRTLLSIVVNTNAVQDGKIRLEHRFFNVASMHFSGDIELLLKAYIQQDRMQDHFDYDKSGLKKIVAIDTGAFVKYITSIYEDFGEDIDRQENLSFIWEVDGAERLVAKAVNIMLNGKKFWGILAHPINVFFKNLDQNSLPVAKRFVLKFIKQNNKYPKRIDVIFDAIRTSVPIFFEEALLSYLTHNTDVEDFRKIHWCGNGGVYSGHVNMGEMKALEWQKVDAIVKKHDNQLQLMLIRNYLKTMINIELQNAEQERTRRFIDNHD